MICHYSLHKRTAISSHSKKINPYAIKVWGVRFTLRHPYKKRKKNIYEKKLRKISSKLRLAQIAQLSAKKGANWQTLSAFALSSAPNTHKSQADRDVLRGTFLTIMGKPLRYYIRLCLCCLLCSASLIILQLSGGAFSLQAGYNTSHTSDNVLLITNAVLMSH